MLRQDPADLGQRCHVGIGGDSRVRIQSTANQLHSLGDFAFVPELQVLSFISLSVRQEIIPPRS